MKKAVKQKPIAHIYAFAATWLIWGFFLPMYRPLHFLIVTAAALAAGFIFAKIFPGKTVFVDVPEPEPVPFSSGNSEVDELIRQGETGIGELKRLKGEIEKTGVEAKVTEIIEISRKIIDNLKEDPSHLDSLRRFFSYYLPTAIKLLNAYDRMYDQGIKGTNISGSMSDIEDILYTLVDALNKQLDSLFAGQALDIETDIEVLEGMLKREGLTGGDFSTGSKNN